MHTIKEVGTSIRQALEQGDLQTFGELLDTHWQTKKQLSSKVTFGEVDRWYELAKNNGALGGKLMGAGGGGFLMFYCNNNKIKIRDAMEAQGLQEMRFKVDPEGAKVLVNF